MKLKVVYAVLMVLVLSFGSVDAEMSVDCSHQWRTFQLSEDREGMNQTCEHTEVDDLYHIKRYFVPDEVCTLCGAFGTGGSVMGSQDPHAFIVKSAASDESMTEISLLCECRDCGYEKSLTISDTAVIEDDADCLIGGCCMPDHHAHMNAAGELVWGSSDSIDDQMFVGIVQMDTGYLLLSREYCIRCGRPRAVVLEELVDVPDGRWHNVEVMTMEAFLTEGMASNLPFRYVDALRRNETE